MELCKTEEIRLETGSEAIEFLSKKDKRMAKLIAMVGPLTYKFYKDQYAFLVHELIEQMLSIKAGVKIYGRLINLCNGAITPEKVAALTDEQIKSIGTSSAKVKYIRTLTEAVLSGAIDFDKLEKMSNNQAMTELLKLHGIGQWTAKMYLIFVLGRTDILPVEDVAFLQGYKWLYNTDDISKESVMRKCKKWGKYSSIAARYLYIAVDEGLVKDKFHLYN